MSLPSRQQRLLRGIDNTLRGSDPRLASMLAIFGRLTAGEEMPGRPPLRAPAGRRRAALLLAASTMAALPARAPGAGARRLHSAGTACAAARRATSWPDAGPATSPRSHAGGTRTGARPGQPGLPQPATIYQELIMRTRGHPSPLPPGPVPVTTGRQPP